MDTFTHKSVSRSIHIIHFCIFRMCAWDISDHTYDDAMSEFYDSFSIRHYRNSFTANDDWTNRLIFQWEGLCIFFCSISFDKLLLFPECVPLLRGQTCDPSSNGDYSQHRERDAPEFRYEIAITAIKTLMNILMSVSGETLYTRSFGPQKDIKRNFLLKPLCLLSSAICRYSNWTPTIHPGRARRIQESSSWLLLYAYAT